MAGWKWVAAATLGCGAALGGCADGGSSRTGMGYSIAGGDTYWGWYGDYYYPGTGVYVYDRYRHRTQWTPQQRGYWEARRSRWHGDGARSSNWRDFDRRH
jgi:hypothetical protein